VVGSLAIPRPGAARQGPPTFMHAAHANQQVPPHSDWKQLPSAAEDVSRRLGSLLRNDARGAQASHTGVISLETVAEMLKTSISTIEFVVEHARYRQSGDRRFQIEGDGVRATNRPMKSWWGTAHIVAANAQVAAGCNGTEQGSADIGPNADISGQEDEVELAMSSPDVDVKQEPEDGGPRAQV